MAEVVEIKQENLVYAKPKLITENVMHYCRVAVTVRFINWLPR